MTPSQELESAFEKKFGRGVVSLTISSQDNTRIWPDFEICSFIAEREALARKETNDKWKEALLRVGFKDQNGVIISWRTAIKPLLTPQDTQVNSKEI